MKLPQLPDPDDLIRLRQELKAVGEIAPGLAIEMFEQQANNPNCPPWCAQVLRDVAASLHLLNLLNPRGKKGIH